MPLDQSGATVGISNRRKPMHGRMNIREPTIEKAAWRRRGNSRAVAGGASTTVGMRCPGPSLEAGTPGKRKADLDHNAALGTERRD